jgi:hypothetical protein
MGQGLQNLKATPAKNAAGEVTSRNIIGNLMSPFTRTASNVLAATPSRTPGIGFLAKAMGQDISWPELLSQQTMGTGISAGAYELGKNTDPAAAKYVRKWVRNLGGRYGVVASTFFEMGQAARLGQPKGEALKKGFIEAAPLPTTEVPKDIIDSVINNVEGKPTFPRFAVPAILQGKKDNSNPAGIVPYNMLSGNSKLRK